MYPESSSLSYDSQEIGQLKQEVNYRGDNERLANYNHLLLLSSLFLPLDAHTTFQQHQEQHQP